MAFPFPYLNYSQNIPSMSDLNWITNSDFRYSGFSGVHSSANRTLNWIFPAFADYTGFTLDPEELTHFDDDNTNVDDMIWENRGPLVFAIVGLMFAFTLTVIGIGWCVALCCCSKKKGKKAWHDAEGKGKQKGKNFVPKIVCAVLMIIWRILFVSFLIGLFVANQQFRNSISELPKDVDNGVVDSGNFIAVTQAQVHGLFVKSFDDLRGRLLEIVGDGGATREAEILFQSSMEKLADLERLGAGHKELSYRIRAIQDNLLDLKARLPGTKAFEDDLENTRIGLRLSAESLNSALDEVPINATRQDIADVEEEFQDAKNYVFQAINGLNLFLLLIIVVLTVGAILGLFSKTKRASSVTINCGLFTIFLTAWIIWIFALAVFLLSGALSVIIPGAFYNITNNGSTGDGDTMGGLRAEDGGYTVPGYQYILRSCKNSASAYVTFELVQAYNISSILNLPDQIGAGDETRANSDISALLSQLAQLKGQTTQIWTGARLSEVNRSIEALESEVSLLRTKLVPTEPEMEEVRRHVSHYAEFVYDEMLENVGSSWPLYNVLTSTLHVFSYKLGSPIGAYWFSLNFLLFLFYPIVITAIVTSRL